VIAALTAYSWPGNVRELRNVLESLVVLARPGATVIGLDDLPENYRNAQPTGPQPAAVAAGPARTMDEIEKEAILRTLQETGGNRTRAAEILGIGLRTLQRKLRDYGHAAGDD